MYTVVLFTVALLVFYAALGRTSQPAATRVPLGELTVLELGRLVRTGFRTLNRLHAQRWSGQQPAVESLPRRHRTRLSEGS